MTDRSLASHLDGNVLTGPLSALFTVEISTAVATCAGCGRVDAVAASQVYGAPMGLIARCVGCGEALLRFAETPAGQTLDLRGISSLRIAAA